MRLRDLNPVKLAARLFRTRPGPKAPRGADPLRRIRARFDAAATTDENRRHWAEADLLAPVSSVTPEVRRVLRARSRYETENNCYARGLISTLAADVVGSGPRLQVTTPDPEFNAFAEREFNRWADAANLADTLRVLEETKRRDGESFALFVTDPTVAARTPVHLGLRLIEADQVADPWGFNPWARPTGDDGLVCDDAGRPAAYRILRAHPGDHRNLGEMFAADTVPAASVLHWFRVDRPGQLRGVPELTPALPLFAMLRRFTLATLTAAEIAAMFAGVLQTEQPPGVEPMKIEPYDAIEMIRGMLVSLPAGWKANQFKPEHPTTQFQSFVDAILREIGRCLDVPFGVMAGDSSKYNYASGRLDHQTYDLRRRIDRQQLRLRVLDRILREWLREASLVWPSVLLRLEYGGLPHDWRFDARPSVDPVKEATADQIRLATRTDTLASIYAERGLDWEEQLRQLAKERTLLASLGLSTSFAQPSTAPAPEDEEVPVAAP